MKICSIQAMLAITLCSLAFAHDNYGQVLDKKVTLTVKGVSIEEALQAIEALTDVKFFYSVDQLGISDKVSLDVSELPLKAVLDELFGPYEIHYRIHERSRTITLKRGDAKSKASKADKLHAQEDREEAREDIVVTVSGTVTDAGTGQPIPGVNILVKGTTSGTSTDTGGNYSIWAEDGDVLVFSFIGYVTFEARVGGRTVIDVSLTEDVKSLKEVEVNAGYYTTTKTFQTGNISKVGAEEIERQPVSDPLAALQGRVPGLEIVPTSGIPGSNFTVRIRGTNSIANGNDPLYIIDGVPYTSTPLSFLETSGSVQGGGASPLNNINPGDIESIEVLKDADATAIYGSRGANGVILITTKKGKSGRTKIDANFSAGIARVANRMDLLSTEQYLEMRREAFNNDGLTPTPGNAPDLLVWDTTRYTDWQEELIGGTANITNAEARISGGNERTQFRLGTGYRSETTVFPGDDINERISVSVSLNNVSDNGKFKTSFTTNYAVVSSNILSRDLTGYALGLAPNAPAAYDAHGELNWNGWPANSENPLAFTKRNFESLTTNLVSNAVMSYSIVDNLDSRVNLGYTNTDYNAVTAIPLSSLSPSVANPMNSSRFAQSGFSNWIIEPQLNWTPRIDDGRFDVLVGTTFMKQKTEGLSQYANGFTSEALMKNISAATETINGTSYYTQYRYHAIFGRLNFNYKSRYIVNLTGRRDGSSRFGPGKQFSFFKAIGAAWIFSSESFIKNGLPFLSYGKFRASYGTAGNDQIGDYQFLDTYAPSTEYSGIIGLSPTRLYNPNFAWEKNEKVEFGIELGFIDDNVLLDVSYYRNRSSNQLVGQPVSPTTGFTSIQANFPATVQNTGIELELNSRNIVGAAFRWNTSLHLTLPRNELVSFPDIHRYPEYDQQYVVGQPLNILKRYHFTGINPITGYYTVEDVNQDGIFNYEDRQIAKFRGRRFFGGLQNTLSFGGFGLDVMFQYVSHAGYDYVQTAQATPGTLANQPVAVLDRWQREGDSAFFQRYTTTGSGVTAYNSFYLLSDDQIKDASFARLKNVSFSYTFASDGLDRVKVVGLRVYVQAHNLLTFTPYRGLDPEFAGRANLPPLMTFIAGCQLTL